MQKTGKTKSPVISVSELKQMITDTEDVIWTVPQLADILGISCAAVRKRIQRGAIPAHKEGHSWYILKSEYIRNLRAK